MAIPMWKMLPPMTIRPSCRRTPFERAYFVRGAGVLRSKYERTSFVVRHREDLSSRNLRDRIYDLNACWFMEMPCIVHKKITLR